LVDVVTDLTHLFPQRRRIFALFQQHADFFGDDIAPMLEGFHLGDDLPSPFVQSDDLVNQGVVIVAPCAQPFLDERWVFANKAQIQHRHHLADFLRASSKACR
jgi:hypothetical protein